MLKLRPIVLALSASLLQACVAPPAKQEMAMQPVLQVRHSSDQTAATYRQLGQYHQERGNLDLAVAAYTHSIVLDGRQLEPRNALAAILARQGRLDEAQSVLLQIVSDYPAVAHPYNNLGYVYYMRGNYSAAATTLQRALALDKDNQRARNNLALVQAAVAGNGEPAAATRSQAAAPGKAIPDMAITDRNVEHAGTANALALAAQQPLIEPGQLADPVASAPPHPQALAPTDPAPAPQALELVQIAPDADEMHQKAEPTIGALPAEPSLVSAKPPAAASTDAAKSFRVEISNGNGVGGMAKRIKQVLGQHGIAVNRLTNERPYTQRDTEIQYRAGYEDHARTLQNALNGHAVAVQSSNLSDRSDVRLLLGKDAVGKLASIDKWGSESNQAMNQAAN